MLQSGIYLGARAERPAPAHGNTIEDNEITGFKMRERCVNPPRRRTELSAATSAARSYHEYPAPPRSRSPKGVRRLPLTYTRESGRI